MNPYNPMRGLVYHEAICQELDAAVAKGGGGELQVSEVAGEDSGGERHEVVDHVHKHRRPRQAEEELQLDPEGRPETPEARLLNV